MRIAYLLTAALPCLALRAMPDELVESRSAGEVLTRTFTMEGEGALEDMAITMDGEELPPEMIGELELEVTHKRSFTVTDEILAAEEGAPSKFKRTFDEVELASTTTASGGPMGDYDGEGGGESGLVEKSVVFSLEDDEWIPAFPEGEEDDDELLEGLIADLSMSWLLPGQEVSEGDTWKVDAEHFINMFQPAGDLHFEMLIDEENPFGTDTADESLGEVEGECQATLVAFREVEGQRMAVIELALDLTAFKDVTAEAQESAEGTEGPGGMELDIQIELSEEASSFEGTGTVLWDMKAARLASLELEIEGNMESTTDVSISFGEQTMEQHQVMVVSGTRNITYTVE